MQNNAPQNHVVHSLYREIWTGNQCCNNGTQPHSHTNKLIRTDQPLRGRRLLCRVRQDRQLNTHNPARQTYQPPCAGLPHQHLFDKDIHRQIVLPTTRQHHCKYNSAQLLILRLYFTKRLKTSSHSSENKARKPCKLPQFSSLHLLFLRQI